MWKCLDNKQQPCHENRRFCTYSSVAQRFPIQTLLGRRSTDLQLALILGRIQLLWKPWLHWNTDQWKIMKIMRLYMIQVEPWKRLCWKVLLIFFRYLRKSPPILHIYEVKLIYAIHLFSNCDMKNYLFCKETFNFLNEQTHLSNYQFN